MYSHRTFCQCMTVIAQDADQQQKNPNRGMEKILTPEQLALLKEQNELVKSQREAFKNSLSDEQLAILEKQRAQQKRKT